MVVLAHTVNQYLHDTPTPLASFVRAFNAYSALADHDRQITKDLVLALRAKAASGAFSLDRRMLDAFRQSPPARAAVESLIALSGDDQDVILDAHGSPHGGAIFWICESSLISQDALLAASYHLAAQGTPKLRVANVVEAMERNGRKVSNHGWLLKKLADATPSLVEILEDASGRRSILFQLTEAGKSEGKRLLELATASKPA